MPNLPYSCYNAELTEADYSKSQLKKGEGFRKVNFNLFVGLFIHAATLPCTALAYVRAGHLAKRVAHAGR